MPNTFAHTQDLAAHAGELPILETTYEDVFEEIADIINETY